MPIISPNMFRWDIKFSYASVFEWVPFELMILPLMLKPDIRS